MSPNDILNFFASLLLNISSRQVASPTCLLLHILLTTSAQMLEEAGDLKKYDLDFTTNSALVPFRA